jgi:hypothetical protein
MTEIIDIEDSGEHIIPQSLPSKRPQSLEMANQTAKEVVDAIK